MNCAFVVLDSPKKPNAGAFFSTVFLENIGQQIFFRDLLTFKRRIHRRDPNYEIKFKREIILMPNMFSPLP